MQAVIICNKTTLETEVFSERSIVKSEDRTMEVAEEIESSEATGEPEMQQESKALAALNAAVSQISSAELTKDDTRKSCTLTETSNDTITYNQEIVKYTCTEKYSNVKKNISVSSVKASCEASESPSALSQSLTPVSFSSLVGNYSSHARSESSQAMTKSSTMIMDLTPAPVKLSDGQANIVNGHSHTLPRQKKQGKTIPTTLVTAFKKLTKSLVSAP